MPFKNRRNKLFHQQGIVAKAKFTAAEDTPYTGVFEGASNVLIRLSEVGFIADGVSDSANPSFALKFLRSGVPSANAFGMVSFEGTDTWDFFGNDFTNHLPVHSNQCALKTVVSLFAHKTEHPWQTGALNLATHKEDGTEVPKADINFPFFLRFVPNPNLPVTDGSSRFFEQLNDVGDRPIPAGTHMFDVYALDLPNDTAEPWSTKDDERWIGSIETTSEFTQSLWGDERLFFQHGLLRDDMRPGRGGRRDIRDNNDLIPTFDTATTLDIWDRSLVVPTPTQQEILDGVAQGCPFQWIIDEFNL